MDFIEEINGAILSGFEGFQQFIKQKLSLNPAYLNQSFWALDGNQMTVLNYLIHSHKESNDDHEASDPLLNLAPHIEYVFTLGSTDKNIGEPIHQAIGTGKIRLASKLLILLKKDPTYSYEQRDTSGRSLISLIIKTLDVGLLQLILDKRININSTSPMTDARILLQPLHQAVISDYADGVRLLSQKGAQVANPVGARVETPVLLAARLGKVSALEALLELDPALLDLEAKNYSGSENNLTRNTAVDELCLRIDNNESIDDAIKGVAMLLCCGAQPPQDPELRKLLSGHREQLLKTVHHFLEDKPKLVDAFVHRCHLKESPLHNIVYADHSWGSSIRHLFGNPSDAAFMVEKLVSRKNANPTSPSFNLLTTAKIKPVSVSEELSLYAEFVRRYTEAYDNQRLTNRWSTMRWMIAEGQADWETVMRYSTNNPSSRTRIIIEEMFKPEEIIHQDVRGEVTEHSSALQ